MKKVVVTGATSMIGVALIKECIERDIQVLAVVREKSCHLNRLPDSGLIKIVECNLDRLDSMEGSGERYDTCYHFGWEYTARETRDNPILQERNIKDTLDAVRMAKRLGCHKFIGAGSQAEYGQVDGVISADTRPEPITSYGIAKLSANMLSRRMCGQLGITHIWGRIFSVYGCNDNEGTMLNYAVDQFSKGRTAKFSAATQMWNYLNEEDAGKMFYLLGVKEVESGVYCIANTESKVLREYIEELAVAFGEGAKCEFAPLDVQAKMIGLKADITKTVDAIGYKPQIMFGDGIRKMIDYNCNFRGGGAENRTPIDRILCMHPLDRRRAA